jgi:phenylacetate-CoA ligase
MTNALRKEVLVEVVEGHLVIEDGVTGFVAECSFEDPLPGDFLARLGADDPRVIAFWEYARSAALTAEFADLPEIWRCQRAAREHELGDPADRLRDQLAYLCTEIPYYASRADAYAPARIQTLDDLERLPFLRKKDLRVHFPDGFVPRGGALPADVRIGISSGSTSERLQAWVSPRVPPIGLEELYGVRQSGRRVFRTAMFTTPFCTGGHCRLGHSTMEERSTEDTILKLNTPEDVFAIQPALVANVFEEIERFRTECLMADPVYLHSLVRKALECGIRVPAVELVLLSFEYGSRLDVEFIRRHVSPIVIDAYGTTEVGDITYGCHRGNVHVREDLLHVEIVRDDRRAAGHQVGAVAVTHLSTKVTPVVRYLVGDVGTLTAGTCDCPIGSWAQFQLHGCAKDMLWLGEQWVTTRQFDDVVSRCAGLDFYAAVQTAEDTIEIAAIPTLGGGFAAEEIESRVRASFGVRKVAVRSATRFEPQPSMKYRLTECAFRSPPEWP